MNGTVAKTERKRIYVAPAVAICRVQSEDMLVGTPINAGIAHSIEYEDYVETTPIQITDEIIFY
jgi:hypothetical protein